MFDIGFGELVLIGIVSLLVFGPDKLPVVARSVGLWWGRLKYTIQGAKNDFDREVGADEIRRQLHNEQVMKELGENEESIRRIMRESEEIARQPRSKSS